MLIATLVIGTYAVADVPSLASTKGMSCPLPSNSEVAQIEHEISKRKLTPDGNKLATFVRYYSLSYPGHSEVLGTLIAPEYAKAVQLGAGDHAQIRSQRPQVYVVCSTPQITASGKCPIIVLAFDRRRKSLGSSMCVTGHFPRLVIE